MAIYVANDRMAMGVITALADEGRRVPEDVSVMGVDDSLENTVPHNRLTTVRFDLLARGRVAFEHAIRGPEPGYKTAAIRIPGTLVERGAVLDVD